jgi:hypothetical protein
VVILHNPATRLLQSLATDEVFYNVDCMNKYTDLSTADFIARCRVGDNAAWQQFFEQFNAFIDQQILRTFRLIEFQHAEDDFDAAKNAVVDILLDPDKLGTIKDVAKFRAWLAQVCRSKASDVARTLRTIKNSADTATRRGMLSLHQPVGSSDTNAVLEDSLASDNRAPDCCDDGEDLFSTVQATIEALEWIYQGPLKISLLFHADFLQHADMKRIVTERSIALESLQAEIACLLDALLQKYAASIKHEAAIRVAAAYVDRLKARCYVLSNHVVGDAAETESITNELERKEHRLAGLLSRKNRPVIPSNSQIGAILAQKENVIATRLFRARKVLEKKLL